MRNFSLSCILFHVFLCSFNVGNSDSEHVLPEEFTMAGPGIQDFEAPQEFTTNTHEGSGFQSPQDFAVNAPEISGFEATQEFRNDAPQNEGKYLVRMWFD